MLARAAVLIVVLALPGLASAQAVATFDRLRDQVNAGDRVRIVDTAGRIYRGTVAGMTDDAIALDRGGGATERLPGAEVREVWMRRPDPVSNGALIGFAALGGTYCALAVSWGNARGCGLPALFFGGLGAGAGALVDAALQRQTLLFRAGAPVAVSLQTGRGGAILAAAVTW